MTFADLFPETIELTKATNAPTWSGSMLDRWGAPLIVTRLVPAWSPAHGWQVGWYAQVDKCVDEWHPNAATKHLQLANYPWYRLDELPSSRSFAIAAGTAARAMKIVIEQMLSYVDQALHDEVHQVQDAIERQAQAWLCGSEA